MLIGAMNHPTADIRKELAWMAAMKLDFVDLTIEPPNTADRIPVAEVRNMLRDTGLQAVGHTAYYLPLASPFEKVRRAAVSELERCIEVFAELGVRWVNLHPDRQTPFHPRSFIIERNQVTIEELLPVARACGVGLMIENLPGDFNTPDQLGELLDPVPDLGLHLDIGHANLLVSANSAEAILKRFGARLRHVHLHDNKGGSADLHLPLGAGTIDLDWTVRILQAAQYDSTITLEVFTPDREYLRYSADILRKAWVRGVAAQEARGA